VCNNNVTQGGNQGVYDFYANFSKKGGFRHFKIAHKSRGGNRDQGNLIRRLHNSKKIVRSLTLNTIFHWHHYRPWDFSQWLFMTKSDYIQEQRPIAMFSIFLSTRVVQSKFSLYSPHNIIQTEDFSYFYYPLCQFCISIP